MRAASHASTGPSGLYVPALHLGTTGSSAAVSDHGRKMAAAWPLRPQGRSPIRSPRFDSTSQSRWSQKPPRAAGSAVHGLASHAPPDRRRTSDRRAGSIGRGGLGPRWRWRTVPVPSPEDGEPRGVVGRLRGGQLLVPRERREFQREPDLLAPVGELTSAIGQQTRRTAPHQAEDGTVRRRIARGKQRRSIVGAGLVGDRAIFRRGPRVHDVGRGIARRVGRRERDVLAIRHPVPSLGDRGQLERAERVCHAIGPWPWKRAPIARAIGGNHRSGTRVRVSSLPPASVSRAFPPPTRQRLRGLERVPARIGRRVASALSAPDRA